MLLHVLLALIAIYFQIFDLKTQEVLLPAVHIHRFFDSATHNVAFLNKVKVSCTFWPGPVSSTSLLNEEQLTTLSPTAAAASKIKPGMKLTEVD